jgi:hypothetical protein
MRNTGQIRGFLPPTWSHFLPGGTSSFGTGVALRQWFDGCQGGHVLLRDNSATLHIKKSAQLTPRPAHRLSDDAATEEAP